MINYFESQRIIFEQVNTLVRKIETIELINCNGRILAEDIFINENIPTFNNSAMDGFALKAKLTRECSETNPFELRILGTIAAGSEDTKINLALTEDGCVEIMTGAKVPEIYDAVVKLEDVIITQDENKHKVIKLKNRIRFGENIRFSGEDFKKGNILFKKNHRIKSQDLMALSALGINEIKVYKKIKVALISTGLEVSSWEEKNLKEGKIRNSTSLYLMEGLKKLDAHVEYWGNIADTESKFLDIVTQIATSGFDLILSTGAVSVGKFDFVTSIISKLNAETFFHKVSIRPGKPILFSKLNVNKKELYFFGLPGNPLASVVGLHFFVEKFINQYYYQEKKLPLLKLANSFDKPKNLTTFYKAKIDVENSSVKILDGQASFMISSFLDANAFVILDENKERVLEGETVPTYIINNY